jgi:hypothetical protein
MCIYYTSETSFSFALPETFFFATENNSDMIYGFVGKEIKSEK